MRTTILVLSVDEAPLLAHSLPAAARQPDAEIVVIDNACTDATVAVAGRAGAQTVAIPGRLSYAAAMNVGLAEVTTPAVLILNADCFLEPGFLEAALGHLAEPGVGSVAGKLVRAAGSERDGSPTEIDAAGMYVNRRRRNGLVGHGWPVSSYSRRAGCFGADGACALYRRDVLTACALPSRASGRPEVFDEDMALWATDADLAWRARLLGYRCVYEPAAAARHVRTYSPSTRAGVSEAHRQLQFRNRYLMWVKNETRAGLLRDLPLIGAHELAALAYVLLRERHLLGGYRAAWAALPGARRRRVEVQARRVVDRVPLGLEPAA